ncbi:MAG: PEP-CTERM sorting domain-containing protein [Acidobacteria bacterium]|nr:PEP-CTERM sorting domain-containing protein [Acidobacteriota bacterium]
MKAKWYWVLAVMAIGLFTSQFAVAEPTYWMATSLVPDTAYAGMIYTTGDVVGKLNAALPTAGHSIPADFDVAGDWDLAGWWEFGVTGSTTNTPGSNWNDVFAGGEWYFRIEWNGSVYTDQIPPQVMPPAIFNQYATWAEIDQQWFMNNPNIYTFFGLYVDEASGGASTPGDPPVGIFAFVADSEFANFDNVEGLMRMGDSYVKPGGEGIATATAPIPEPSTMLLLGLGLAGIAGLKLRKK